MDIRPKRAYDPPTPADGYRVLIDRLWPRGVPRERANLDAWAKELAPSTQLREWFGHEPGRFDEFRRRYVDELRSQRSALTVLRRRARNGTVTLVYAAGDEQHNDAVVLAEVVRRGLPRASTPTMTRATEPRLEPPGFLPHEPGEFAADTGCDPWCKTLGEANVMAMSRTDAIDTAIGPLQGSSLARRWSAVRARVAAGRLDIELAAGADPWSSTELMLRAARISSPAERRTLVAGLTTLIGQARRSTPFGAVQIRSRLVLEHAHELLLLANRLRQPEPVDIVTLAELGLLLRDGTSPIYVGGRPPEELMRVIARALQELELV